MSHQFPEALFERLLAWTAQRCQEATHETWLFRGRVVEVVDGWTVTMADMVPASGSPFINVLSERIKHTGRNGPARPRMKRDGLSSIELVNSIREKSATDGHGSTRMNILGDDPCKFGLIRGREKWCQTLLGCA